MQYVAHPGLDDPRSNALRELMNAANELEALQGHMDRLVAFRDDVDYRGFLSVDSGIVKTGEDVETYDFDDLLTFMESHLEKQVAECKAKVDKLYLQVCKLKIRRPSVKKPEPVTDEMPY